MSEIDGCMRLNCSYFKKFMLKNAPQPFLFTKRRTFHSETKNRRGVSYDFIMHHPFFIQPNCKTYFTRAAHLFSAIFNIKKSLHPAKNFSFRGMIK